MRLKIINIFTLMSNKVSPETTSSYVYNENYNDENKNILRVKPNDNLELGKCKNKCHKCYNSSLIIRRTGNIFLDSMWL